MRYMEGEYEIYGGRVRDIWRENMRCMEGE